MKNERTVLNYVLTAVLLMALWFIMSGKTETKFLILGAVSSLLIAGLCLRTLTIKGANSDRDYYLLCVNPIRLIIYLFWLLKEIIKSAVNVSFVTTVKRSEVDPSIAWFKAAYDNPAARAMLANSITLTPGTITIDISDEGIFSVHALTKSIREGLLDGTMQAKVAWLFNESIDFSPVDPEDISNQTVKLQQPAPAKKYIVRRKKP